MSILININDIKKYINIFNKKCNKLNNFLKSYEVIVSEDNVKPIFSQTTRYNQFPKNKYSYSNKPNPLFNINNNAWIPTKNENECFLKKIKIILNKITPNNFDKIIINFIEIINKINDIDNIKEINKILILKIIKDKEFHNMYFKLCKTIWNNDTLRYNIIKIYKKTNKYYWQYNGKENDFIQPFNIIDTIKSNINSTINFKKMLITDLLFEINNKNIYFNKIKEMDNDDEIFKIKNKIFSISLFITKLYKFKEINEIEYNNLLYKFIDKDIFKEDIETIYIILKEYNNIFSNTFIDIIKEKLHNISILNKDKRTEYFLEYIKDNISLNKSLNKSLNNDKPSINSEDMYSKYVSNNLSVLAFNRLNITDIPDLLDIIVYDIFENNINNKKILKLISYLYSKRKIHRRHIIKQLYITIENISDILIDYPNASKYFIEFIENLSVDIKVNLINNKFVNKLIKSISNLNYLNIIIIEILNNCTKITNSAYESLKIYIKNNQVESNS